MGTTSNRAAVRSPRKRPATKPPVPAAASVDEIEAATARIAAEARDRILAAGDPGAAEAMQQVIDAVAQQGESVKDRMLRNRLAAQPFDVDGLGTIRVRALSSTEVRTTRESYPDDDQGFERALVALALVDPKLTPAEVEVWFTSCPAGESVEVLGHVMAMSRLGKDAQKSDVLGVRE